VESDPGRASPAIEKESLPGLRRQQEPIPRSARNDTLLEKAADSLHSLRSGTESHGSGAETAPATRVRDLADVVQVAQADAHVMLDVIGHGDSDGDSDQAVPEPERKHRAVAAEQLAQQPSPQEGDRSQHRIGQMRDSKQEGGRKAGQHSVVHHLFETRKEEYLLDVLLDDRPEKIAARMAQRIARAKQSVQGTQTRSPYHDASGNQDRRQDQHRSHLGWGHSESVSAPLP